MIGKEIRMERILDRVNRTTIIVPMDHGVSVGPVSGLTDMSQAVDEVALGGANAVVMHKGLVKSGHRRGGNDLGLIVHLSGSTSLSPEPNAKALVCTVEEAIKLGADAVSVHVNLGNDAEKDMLTDLSTVARIANEWGMPLLAMIYPRGEKVHDEYDPELIKHAARIGAELGELDALAVEAGAGVGRADGAGEHHRLLCGADGDERSLDDEPRGLEELDARARLDGEGGARLDRHHAGEDQRALGGAPGGVGGEVALEVCARLLPCLHGAQEGRGAAVDAVGLLVVVSRRGRKGPLRARGRPEAGGPQHALPSRVKGDRLHAVGMDAPAAQLPASAAVLADIDGRRVDAHGHQVRIPGADGQREGHLAHLAAGHAAGLLLGRTQRHVSPHGLGGRTRTGEHNQQGHGGLHEHASPSMSKTASRERLDADMIAGISFAGQKRSTTARGSPAGASHVEVRNPAL